MKKYSSENQALNELLVQNGINLVCNNNMEIIICDEDAERIEKIIKEKAPAAIEDFTIEDIN